MERFVARLNIEHLREALGTETDEAKRQTLTRLLSDEEAKLAAAFGRAKKEEAKNAG